ncbi:hypothetical protein M422DRAFT_261676 [Sphaerobolus stellatus SS14]|uniref:Uncharacterized protein n=1 Tax=Sphaerobolus stellatus (strain SS14) TaxID=990650 RepID=A0A0C9V2Q6_SPHS4|nr:hypothetical protein M422DRAFT_261676 [Sphaerobolus stellatus SS14]
MVVHSLRVDRKPKRAYVIQRRPQCVEQVYAKVQPREAPYERRIRRTNDVGVGHMNFDTGIFFVLTAEEDQPTIRSVGGIFSSSSTQRILYLHNHVIPPVSPAFRILLSSILPRPNPEPAPRPPIEFFACELAVEGQEIIGGVWLDGNVRAMYAHAKIFDGDNAFFIHGMMEASESIGIDAKARGSSNPTSLVTGSPLNKDILVIVDELDMTLHELLDQQSGLIFSFKTRCFLNGFEYEAYRDIASERIRYIAFSEYKFSKTREEVTTLRN